MRQTVLLAASLALLTPAFPAPLASQIGGVDTTAYSGLRWRNTGPARGGRSVAAAGSVARPNEYWMGTTGGGVFKSTDGGENWSPVSDKHFGGTIGAIAVAPTNPDVVYVGGGEFPIRGNTSHGDGVYKTTDAGRTWRYIGLVETRHISKIRIHPNNPDVVYLAALGKVWGPSPERGIFKSSDGGESWRKVLFRNDSTGAIDLSMDPNDPNVLYAALWQAGRTPWMLNSGGAGGGIFKSTDGGETWREITRNPGLPKGILGNIGISASPVQRGRVWAQIEAEDGGVFLSDDGGASWEKVNSERKLRQRAWYYSRIYADTKDANTVYASNVQFQRSTDGGRTWTNIRAPHGDSHDMWMAPDNNQRMIETNDGGANVSLNAGASWTAQDFLTAQFYHVTTTKHFPYHICGAQQDNSTICGASRPSFGSNIEAWYDVGGGESGYIAARPDNPDIVYAGSYGGYLTRKDTRTGLERAINPWPMNPMGHSAKDLKYRFQWTYPIVISPHDPNTLYVAGNVLFKSTDDGQSFAPISPDLTRNDPQTLGPSGGPITKDQTSVEYYGTIFTVAESPLEKGVIWTGSDDGLVQLTRDGGTTWTNVTPPDMERYTRVSIIEASAHRKGTLYVAANRFQLNDNRPYLWKT
ncbi:MAG: glycosyl hydrolase, partial [Gemmatimonadota bacterium]